MEYKNSRAKVIFFEIFRKNVGKNAIFCYVSVHISTKCTNLCTFCILLFYALFAYYYLILQ